MNAIDSSKSRVSADIARIMAPELSYGRPYDSSAYITLQFHGTSGSHMRYFPVDKTALFLDSRFVLLSHRNRKKQNSSRELDQTFDTSDREILLFSSELDKCFSFTLLILNQTLTNSIPKTDRSTTDDRRVRLRSSNTPCDMNTNTYGSYCQRRHRGIIQRPAFRKAYIVCTSTGRCKALHIHSYHVRSCAQFGTPQSRDRHIIFAYPQLLIYLK